MKNFLLITAIFTMMTATAAMSQVKLDEIEQYEIKSYDP